MDKINGQRASDFPRWTERQKKWVKTFYADQWHKFSQKVVNGDLTLQGKLKPEEVRELADWLATSPPEPLSLNLSCRGIDEADAASLAEALKTNKALATLDLSSNDVGADGAALLAKALKTNTTLTTLNLGHNEIDAAGAASLADALKTNTTLTTLHLYGNKFSNPGAACLAEALKTNATLTTLTVWSSDIDEKYLKEIEKKLQENRRLKMQEGAALALELASDGQYPREIMRLIVHQLVVLPPVQREKGLVTIQKLSKSVDYPPRKT